MTDRSVVYRLKADLTSFRAQMAQAGASTRKLAGDLTAVGKEGDKTRRGLDTLGGAAGKIGLVAAAGLGAAVIKAANFDSAMSKVQAATHESASEMEALRKAALDAGAQTAFSATEAAAGIENLAKAGVSTEEILSGGLMGALDLAAAGEMDVADAAEAAAGAMAQFKLDGEDVPHIADLLAAGAGKAQGEVSDMVMALKQGGTVASQTGLTIEETAGSFAALAEQSLLGSDAGTSFKQMLASLTPNSAKAAEVMEELGFSAFDAQGNFVGMEELAGRLREAFKGMSDEQRLARMETIFGSDAVRAASIIYDNGAEGIGKWIEKVDDAGFAAETAAIKQDNLRGDLEKLGGALETALIGTGEGAQGPLRSVVQTIEDVVNAYNKLPDGAKGAVAGMLGAAAVLGGSIWVGTKLVRGIADTREALENLGISADKQKGALRGLAAAGAGLAVLTAGAAAIRAINDAARESLPGVEGMTAALLDLADGGVATALGEQYMDLGDDLDRLFDKDWDQKVGDTLYTPFKSVFGETRDTQEALDEIEALDGALANLVNTRGPQVAADALQSLADSGAISAEQLSSLRQELPQYEDALAGVSNEADLASGEQEKLEGATSKATKAAQRQVDAAKRQAEALKESRDAARETGEEFFGIGEKVDKAKVSLGEWLRDLEKQADALRNFRINAREAADKGLDQGLIKSLEEAGPAGALRMKQLADATDDEIDRANRAWRRGQREIKLYTDAVGGVPKPKPVPIDVDTANAIHNIKALKHELQQLKGREIPVRLTATGIAKGGTGFGPQGGFASGGWTGPGGKYQPAGIVHGDEYVFSKEATHGNVAMLERLHRQLRGYASGGLVQRHAAPVSVGGGGVDIDYHRLAGALAAIRPPGQLYGDVHISGDPASFKRAMLADKQAAGLGGH